MTLLNTQKPPDEQYIDFLTEHMLPSEEHTLENVHKITEWVHAHLNEDGQIKEVTHSAYGRILDRKSVGRERVF